MRRFFLDRVRTDSLLDGQHHVYMHYADMIANGCRREAPCLFQTQGVMLNPDGGLLVRLSRRCPARPTSLFRASSEPATIRAPRTPPPLTARTP